MVRNKLFFFGAYEGYRVRSFAPISGGVPTKDLRDMAIAAVPAYKAFFDFWDLPTKPYRAGSNTGLYIGAASQQFNDDTGLVRSDYHISLSNGSGARKWRPRALRT